MIGHKDRKTKEAENGEREVSWGKDSGGLSGEGDTSALKGTKEQAYAMKSGAQEVLAAWGRLAFPDPHVDVGAMYPQLLLPYQAWAPPTLCP